MRGIPVNDRIDAGITVTRGIKMDGSLTIQVNEAPLEGRACSAVITRYEYVLGLLRLGPPFE
jgi:hypothetical protein